MIRSIEGSLSPKKRNGSKTGKGDIAGNGPEDDRKQWMTRKDITAEECAAFWSRLKKEAESLEGHQNPASRKLLIPAGTVEMEVL